MFSFLFEQYHFLNKFPVACSVSLCLLFIPFSSVFVPVISVLFGRKVSASVRKANNIVLINLTYAVISSNDCHSCILHTSVLSGGYCSKKRLIKVGRYLMIYSFFFINCLNWMWSDMRIFTVWLYLICIVCSDTVALYRRRNEAGIVKRTHAICNWITVAIPVGYSSEAYGQLNCIKYQLQGRSVAQASIKTN